VVEGGGVLVAATEAGVAILRAHGRLLTIAIGQA
jgi:hypothetical protein